MATSDRIQQWFQAGIVAVAIGGGWIYLSDLARDIKDDNMQTQRSLQTLMSETMEVYEALIYRANEEREDDALWLDFDHEVDRNMEIQHNSIHSKLDQLTVRFETMDSELLYRIGYEHGLAACTH